MLNIKGDFFELESIPSGVCCDNKIFLLILVLIRKLFIYFTVFSYFNKMQYSKMDSFLANI